MGARGVACALAAGIGFVTLGWTSAARADDKSVTGDWKWEFKRQNGDAVQITLKLKQDGDKVTGTVSGVGGMETEIKEGKFKDGEVSFEVTRERNGQTFTTKYKGKLEGDTIKGKSSREVNGETQERDWEAKRA
jgi:hypothetical protein